MTLASIYFSAPFMLLGLLAAGIPVLLHLLNRIRSPIVPFPTLRFLKITAQKTSRRRQLQQWLLLLLRMVIFALLAIAAAGLLIPGGNPTLAYGLIVLLLVGLASLALGIISLGNALSARHPPPPTIDPLHPNVPPPAPPSPARYLSLAGLLLPVSLLALGYSFYAFASDRYFNGSLGQYSGRHTACVIILDNSHSMLARQDSQSRWQKAREQVRQLLAEQLAPAEVAILPTNPGTNPLPDRLTTDFTAALGYVEKLENVGRAQKMKKLVTQAVQLLATSTQPNRLLVIVSDMTHQAFADAEVFSALSQINERDQRQFQVVLMPQGAGSPPADVGIATFTIASGQPVIGNEILLEGLVVNNGDAAVAPDLALLVDDQPVPGISPRVALGPGGPGGKAPVKIAYRLPAAGVHRFALQVLDPGGAMAWDDKRQLVLDVAQQVRVLVVGAEDQLRPRTTAFYVTAALDPFGGKPPAGAGGKEGGKEGGAWAIAPTYRSVHQLANQSLASYPAIFLCDVPQIPPALAESLEKYVQAGGRLVWLLGPSVNAPAYNADVGRVRKLLPADLGTAQVSPVGGTLDYVETKSDIFANLFDTNDPFRGIIVTGRWTLPAALQRGVVLARLDDGAPLLTQHLVGRGEVYTLLSAPSADWSNMATTVTFLPMLSRMALGDSGRLRAEAAYEPQQPVRLPVPSSDAALTLDVRTPRQETVNVRATSAGGEPPRWEFSRTLQEGSYHWQSADGKFHGEFIINPPGEEEVDLLPQDVDALAREIRLPNPTIVAPTVADLVSQMATRAEGVSLAPGVLAFVLILLLTEALLANRHRPALRPAASSTSSAAPSTAPASSAASAA